MLIDDEKLDPSKTNVWNSPFSPHGSTGRKIGDEILIDDTASEGCIQLCEIYRNDYCPEACGDEITQECDSVAAPDGEVRIEAYPHHRRHPIGM